MNSILQGVRTSILILRQSVRCCSTKSGTSLTANSAPAWSSKLPEYARSQSWTKAYGCPTCTLRFSGWHKCLKHLKGHQHVRPGSYSTKEQLRLLLELPHRDAELPKAVVTLLRNNTVTDRSDGTEAKAQDDANQYKTQWMYECPLCHYACSKWSQMWAHVGRTGHITKESYKTEHQLRLLVRKEKPRGSLALAFQPGVQWAEAGEPVRADGEVSRVLLKGGAEVLVSPPSHSSPTIPDQQQAETDAVAPSTSVLDGRNPQEEPKDSTSAGPSRSEQGRAEVEWTDAMQYALQDAFKEYPANLRWRDRHQLIADRVGRGVTKHDVAARVAHLNRIRGGGGLSLSELSLEHGYVAVDWECCGEGDAVTGCRATCLAGRASWVWVDKHAPPAVLARARRGVFLKPIPRPVQVRHGPRVGELLSRPVPAARRPCEARAGYRCPGCGFLADRYIRLHAHLASPAGRACLPAGRGRVHHEVRLRGWLVAPAVKEAWARAAQVDPAGWGADWDADSDWRRDARPAARAEHPPRPAPPDLVPGFQLLV